MKEKPAEAVPHLRRGLELNDIFEPTRLRLVQALARSEKLEEGLELYVPHAKRWAPIGLTRQMLENLREVEASLLAKVLARLRKAVDDDPRTPTCTRTSPRR